MLVPLLLLQAAAPVLPIQVSAEFHGRVMAVEKLLESGDFAGAKSELAKLPTKEVELAWDDSLAPEADRAALVQARDQAIRTWTMFAPTLHVSMREGAPFRLRLVPSLEVRGRPMGLLMKLDRPAAEAQIALNRGTPSFSSTVANIHNDVVKAIGAYLGVGDAPVAISAMFPNHGQTQRLMLTRQDSNAALANLQALAALREAAEAGQKLTPAGAKMSAPAEVALGRMLNGPVKQMDIPISNEGNGPLQLWIKGDCGCLVVQPFQTWQPGEKRAISINLDTREFDGDIVKHLILASNDPEHAIQTITLAGNVRPMYRFIAPGGTTAIVDDKGGKVELYLTFTEVEPFRVKKVDLAGLPGEVDYEGWQGKMVDAQSGEGELARKGYKFTITMPAHLPPGRSPATLMIQTDSPIHPQLQFNLSAQKGIVALPDELYLGDLAGAKTAKFLVSRPGKPFKITAVDSQSANLKATYRAVREDEFEVEVAYDGAAAKGDFTTSLTVKTDDPKQPSIRVPVSGTVK